MSDSQNEMYPEIKVFQLEEYTWHFDKCLRQELSFTEALVRLIRAQAKTIKDDYKLLNAISVAIEPWGEC